ncbi:GGDEF domain-containing protein [Pulveribacter suum]|uniref:diguanylate cyclase n=1 Tax=Pulveribacter suum TaxID=2116657 RepID=A0A2P1NL51_9BURK|nr:GGDEF domain-containing protein [Pulveribacter suum]AVP57798.1 GGDEF domain-containing protein [Pulveribacter suum]
MSSLDPRSLIIMANFMALVMGAVLGFMWRQYPRTIHGLREWALMPAVWIVGAFLYLVPGRTEVMLWLANAGVLAGFGLFHLGCLYFLDRPAPVRALLGAFALLMGALGWFTWGAPSYVARVVVVSAAIAALHAWTLVVLWRHGTRRLPTRLVQLTLSVHLVILLVRMQSAMTARQIEGLMEPSSVQTFYIGAFVMTVLTLSIGALLMATDRVRSEFEHLAAHDSLTEALNRRAILALCQDEQDRSLRQPRPFSLMMLDLDHFKAINDNHGHQHGDRVLAHFAHTLRGVLRRTDRLGRYGGEEFLVLLPGTDAQAATALAGRMRAALASGHPLDCKVSIGVTEWQGAADSIDGMLARADAALYQAKAQGRDRTCVG